MVVKQNRMGRRRDGSTAWLLFVCGIWLSGCASVQSLAEDMASRATLAPTTPETLRLRPLASTASSVSTRSYRVGEAYTSRVGEPMLSVKNYEVGEKVARATALRDFEQLCGRLLSNEPGSCSDSPLVSVRGGTGSVFEVQGAVSTLDGDYFALSLPAANKKDVAYLLVDTKGRPRPGAYVAWRQADSNGYSVAGVPLVEVSPDIPLDDDAPLFAFDNQQAVAASGPGYLNYELVYLGRRSTAGGDSIVLSYREFARQSPDHVTFEQTLPYPVSQRDIDIAGLRLRVDATGPESITFRVVGDSRRGAEQR